MKTILFVSHDANRAGAQIVLLEVIKQLKQRGAAMHLLLGGGGPLEADFEKLLPMIKLPQPRNFFFGVRIDKLLALLGILPFFQRRDANKQRSLFEKNMADAKIDLVFMNTVASSALFKEIEHLQKPVVLFAHELAMAVEIYTDPAQLAHTFRHTNRLLVVAQALADYYVQVHAFLPKNVSIFTHIDTREMLVKIDNARKSNVRMRYNVPAGAILVGGCGNAELRKGNDLFLGLAKSVLKKYPENVYFMWVGLPKNTELHTVQAFDIAKMGLTDKIILVEPTSAVFDYTTQFDIFALTSREDPYPLVALEAALNQTPIVCFEQSGGLPDLIAEDAGAVVPYADVEAMSAVVQGWIENPKMRKALGKNAQNKVIERHDPTKSIDNLCAILAEVSGAKNIL